MKVRATEPGIYLEYRGKGAEFDVPEDFKASWVEVVGEAEASPAAQDESSEQTQSEIADLRSAYKERFGKRAFPGWDADTLKAKLAEEPQPE